MDSALGPTHTVAPLKDPVERTEDGRGSGERRMLIKQADGKVVQMGKPEDMCIQQ